MPRTRNKYKAKASYEDGHRFLSQLELGRYQELKLLTKAKGNERIYELQLHPQYPIFINSRHICMVELDFQYRDSRGTLHVEDTKGVDTVLSKLKRKLVEAVHSLKVELVH